MEKVTFQAAVQVARRGDRKNAFAMMRQVLLDNPANVAAWIWMSELVDDTNQKRECLERALLLDPSCKPAREGLEVLRLRDLLAATPAPVLAERKQEALRIGEYLVQQGFLTKAQLSEALAEQRNCQNYIGDRTPLGDILVRRGWLSPQALADALVKQLNQHGAPQRLGEYLVTRGFITPEHLARVLAEQSWLRQRGKNVPLGEILIRSGYLSHKVLSEVLDQQSKDFFSRFGD